MTPQTISILAAVRAIGGAVRECEAPAALLGGAIGTARLTIRDQALTTIAQAHAYIADNEDTADGVVANTLAMLDNLAGELNGLV